MATGAELTYNTGAKALAMANEIFGTGTIVLNASYTGKDDSSAIFSNGDAIAPNVVPSDTGVIFSTGLADNFTQSDGDPNRSGGTSTITKGPDNDADFNSIAVSNTYDASFLTADFIPTGDTMSMQFMFGSEEYPDYVMSIYNDVVGVWINGAHVPLSITGESASVNTAAEAGNTNLFLDNTNDDYNTEMDGFTITMTLTIPVNPGVVNTIKLGIADVGDSKFDSNVLIAGNSLQTALIAEDDSYTMQEGTTKTFDLLSNDTNLTGATMTITHINGIEVFPGDTVMLGSGQSVFINPDGTVAITTDTDNDTINFTYTIESGSETDTGFVTVETIPCFVAGTMIQTPDGLRAVETLQPGDLVDTRDDGPQPIRWAGARRVQARGDMAPVRIKAGTFGKHAALMVSPLHRVLVKDAMAEILFGEDEVLISARDLVNDRSIRRVEGGEVEYVHIMFDRHQVIWSNGLATESFLFGPQTRDIFEDEILDELCAIFPDLDPATGLGYGPAVRPCLKRYEADALIRRAA